MLNEALISATTAYKISTVSWLVITFIFSLPVSFIIKLLYHSKRHYEKIFLGLAFVESFIPSKIIWFICSFAIATETLPLSSPSDHNKPSRLPGNSLITTSKFRN